MKKGIIGRVTDRSGVRSYWTFENDEKRYSMNVVNAIDELLDIHSKNGGKFKITIEQLN